MASSKRIPATPLAWLCLAIMFITGCTGAQVDRGQTDTFAERGYRTYNWNYAQIKTIPSDNSPYAVLSPVFREEMNSVLKNLGYREVDKGGEFVVSLQFKQSFNDGVVSVEKKDDDFATQAIINRNPDQASLDNAQALAGPREVANILLQFDDASDGGLLWAAAISRVIETVNENEIETENVRRFARQTIRRATIQLPRAPE